MAQTLLEKKLNEVEEYGFERQNFPISYNGHVLTILSNDAHRSEDGRIRFDLMLHCKKCRTTSSISGHFPEHYDNQERLVVNAKVAVFAKFDAIEC